MQKLYKFKNKKNITIFAVKNIFYGKKCKTLNKNIKILYYNELCRNYTNAKIKLQFYITMNYLEIIQIQK